MTEPSQTDNVLLKADHVGVSYSLKGGWFRRNRYWALKDISLTLSQGEALGIVGRNGVGKSTLLRILAGIMRPDTGSVSSNAEGITLLSIQIGFLGHLTGRENAVLSAMLQGMRKKDIVARLEEVKEFSELGDFFEQQLSTYSTGMRSRLGFSVALQLNPEVILIDEVTSVGDAAFQQKSFEALRKRIDDNRSIILVSHAPNILQQICNRVVWIENGEVEQIGPTQEVLNAYRLTVIKAREENSGG